MTEEENVSRASGFFQLGGFVGKDFTGRAIFLGSFESMGILELWRMKRKGDDGLAAEGRVRSKRQKCHFVFAGEGIWGGEEKSDVVFRVHSDDGRLKKARWAIGAADEDVGLAAVAKGFKDVGDRQKVTLFVNEEGVAKEAVVVTARGCRLVKLINDGADSGGERGVVRKVIGRGSDRQAAEETSEQSYKPRGSTFVVLAQLPQ
jgi:hypothetical protein